MKDYKPLTSVVKKLKDECDELESKVRQYFDSDEEFEEALWEAQCELWDLKEAELRDNGELDEELE